MIYCWQFHRDCKNCQNLYPKVGRSEISQITLHKW